MTYDWTGLLDAIEAHSAHRVSSLIDNEAEDLRRNRVFGFAKVSQPRRRFVATGIANKPPPGAVSSNEPTISSILQVLPAPRQSVITMIGDLGGAGRKLDDDDDELSRSTGGGGGSGVSAPRTARPISTRHAATDRSWAETVSRAAIAAGAQPVVIKVTSTVSSRASAAGLMTYLGTRDVEKENGEKDKIDIPIHDQDGHAIASRQDRAAVLAEWGADFRDAYAVNALATLSMIPSDVLDEDSLHDALNAAFGSNPYLFSRHPDGKISVYAVTDLSAKKIASVLKAREKGEGPARTAQNAEADLARRLADAGVSAEVRILGAAVSEQSGRYFLEKFLRTEKDVIANTVNPVTGASSFREKADDIWRAWSPHIRTVEPRNAFHVIFSARAGTDPEAMVRTVRDFLSEQVAGHRWITAHHPETGHVHVHAMISARDDVGKALRLTKPELYEWRERFAAKAREHGIAMVATRRADVAATRPYSQAQAGACERGKNDPRYLKTPSVTKRVERKRAGAVEHASLTNGNFALAQKWQATASALKEVGAEPSVIAAADRFAAAANGVVAQMVSGTTNDGALSGLRHLVATIQQQKEKTTVLSLEQFDARVSRANRSMDRLEAMVDSGKERQAVEEMRREMSTLFAKQRRDIEMHQMRLITEIAMERGMPPAVRADEPRMRGQDTLPMVDPAIAAQQQGIADGRAARAAREQAEAAKAVRQEQRQEILRQATQERQRDRDPDGPER
ncbi:relaxase/mobilization nuclease domain-containing protein [Shinella sp. S4-D37]|uniref:relaxase/mobilization nuclease domain-containing protein n=1 Tax=Shinella sp. S4-D37 TaxID=3161999 RepID=UPI0034655A24